MEKQYQLDIDPRILELLGPSLYTNIYYVLAELIANAYDADARNVYIIEHADYIAVEDDGSGMSYTKGDIKKYLNVAAESRTNDGNSQTLLYKRRKMGRKGVGKLAALSVSENVDVKTVVNGEQSGFILSRHVDSNKILKALDEEKIIFEKIKDHGTSIVMKKPQYRLNKSLDVVKKNLLKIFPLVDDEFKIHILREGKEVVLENLDQEITKQLCTLITFGDEFRYLTDLCENKYKERQFVEGRSEWISHVKMIGKNEKEIDCELKLKGWIGTYASTRGRKIGGVEEFQDNFISLYANKKMGEFNILPQVGANKLNEVFVVGQLHIDAFERTDMPDMALSNRQGYKSDDPRYQRVLNYVKSELLPEILNKRTEFATLTRKDKEKRQLKKQKDDEKKFRESVDDFKEKASQDAADRITKLFPSYEGSAVKQIVSDAINTQSPALGIKTQLDNQKKKILISHTRMDKNVADLVYSMLLFNNVPAIDIIYSNCDDYKSRIPDGIDIYEYLRDFFVESYSKQKMLVFFVTSENIQKSWGAMSEVGAAWITQMGHKLLTINGFRPQAPLKVGETWVNVLENGDELEMDSVNADEFCVKICNVCKLLGYSAKSLPDNKDRLRTLISVT